MRLIDLSTTIAEAPDRPNPKIDYIDHRRTALERAEQQGMSPEQFPIPYIHFASERLTAVVHATATHVDAPFHYGPECEGKPARTIDQLPLEWFYGDGVVLDFSQQQDGGVLTAADVERALDGYPLKPFDIVLVRTDLDKSDDPRKFSRLRELSRDSVGYLLDRGVKVIGIDSISPDKGHFDEVRAGNPQAMYQAHMYGREREFCFVEILTNLHLLPHHGFQVSLFPVKIEHGSGGWCRAVAFLPD
ncbi:MAG: cyclase family protein [Dehalococcoidia bacterium]